MRIDSHQHFWNFDPVRDAWIDDTMKVLQRDFVPTDLKPVYHDNNIQGCVAVQADESENETRFLLKLSKDHEFIKGVVGWLDLKSPDLVERLDHFSSEEKLKGIRHIVQKEPVEFMLDPDFQTGISKLEPYGLAYDILVFPHQLKSAIELVRKFPKQHFVLDHLAKPYIKDKNFANWIEDIKELATNENTHCKISGMVTEADWKNWKIEDFGPFLDVILDSFGPDRMMYGSDWPVCLLAASYQEQLNIVESYIAQLSEIEKAKIMGLNCKNFYRL